VMARALVEKASKLSKSDNSSVKAYAYYGNLDAKQRQKDFSNIDVAWAGISFEVMGHFDIVIAITNIATPVHVKALAQMLYRIRDSPRRCENIRAKLESARPKNLPTAIKGHHEWDNNTISYKIDESPAVITFIEVEHQKHLSARYFIEKLCSLIASTGASLQLIKIDESRGVIENHKRIHNVVRVEALVIKEIDFNTVATSRNFDSEEAKILKFDQERSIADTIALKRFYMRNLYSAKDVNIDDWNNLCNKKFMECFKDIYYKARENVEKSVAEDLYKLYSANYWKAIREPFQILGFTGIDDIHTLSGNIISEAFAQSCERFIEIR
ncbi:20192_t:CDS:2, partial [Gigaspora margarita]